MSLWFDQKHKLEEASRRLVASKSAEAAWRSEFKGRFWAAYTKVSTMVWVSITGAIWASRIRGDEEGENPLLAVLTAVWIARRWRRLPDKLHDAYLDAQGGESPDTVPAGVPDHRSSSGAYPRSRAPGVG